MTPTQIRSFWDRTEEMPGTGCLIWLGRRESRKRYGQYVRYDPGSKKYQMFLPHRVAYELLVGPIEPVDLTIDHRCGNQLCVNPDHLEPVTRAENTRRGGKKVIALEQRIIELETELAEMRLRFGLGSPPSTTGEGQEGLGGSAAARSGGDS